MISVNILGLIWLVLLLYSFSKRMYTTIALTIISIIFQKALFVTVGSVRITLFDISVFFLIIRFILQRNIRLTINGIGKTVLLMGVTFVLASFLTGIINNDYSVILYEERDIWESSKGIYQIGTYDVGINGSLIIVLIRHLLYCFAFVMIMAYAKTKSQIENDKFIIKVLYSSIIIVVFIGAIQLMNYYGYFDFNWFMRIVHDSNNGGSAYYSNYDRLYSCFAEPSYCAPWLCAAFWALAYKEKQTKDYILQGIVLIEFLLCRSFTGYITFLIIYLWHIYRNKRKRVFLACIISIFVVIAVLIFTPYGKNIVLVVNYKMASNSGVSRIAFIKDCYRVFIETNFMGAGYMTVKSMTLIGGLLAQVGFLGTGVFIFLLTKLLLVKTYTNIQYIAKIFFWSVLIGGEVSCSGLHWLVPFWYGFFLLAIAYGNADLSFKNKMTKHY